MSKVINKWIGAYESVKRLQGSDWSEDDVLAKAQELFACGKNVQFTLKEEWHALRDQPRYGSQMGGNVRSGSSGSKRSNEDSVGSSARPMGREASKKKGKKKRKDAALEEVEKEWVKFKEIKVQEIEKMKEFTLVL
ncbi:glutathione S-transferase T2-like [Medicago truncatula]|uniref:glutathione S-transferase T2-like n=1 Tax=Medicago truncatula TaxID=3880 RepID=UPI0019680CE2|nr:glutathione S-transferase T2-like [Medicago truncatula]